MQLILENFRQHKYLKLDLPDAGLVLIQGPSGAGKSSILDAILFALYGIGDDVIPWGETKTKVTLLTPTIEIERTKGPISLKVQSLPSVDEVFYRDEAAQAIINRMFGMGSDEFLASSYIRQGMEGSLLSLQPAEQLRFIQDLSKGETDPDAIKNDISEKIRELNTALAVEESSIESKKKAAATQKEQLDRKMAAVPEDPLRPTDSFEAKAQAEASDSLSIVQKTLKSLRDQCRSPLYDLADKLKNAKERYDSVSVKNETQIDELTNRLKDVPEINDIQISTERVKIHNKSKYLSSKNKIVAIANQIYTMFPELKDTKLSSSVPQKLQSIDKLIEATITNLDAKKISLSEFEKYNKPHTCPACKTSLRLNGGQLVLHTDTVIEDVETAKAKVKNEIKDLSATLVRYRSDKDFLTLNLKQCESFKADMGEDPYVGLSLSEAEALLAQMLNQSETRQKIEREINNLQSEIIRERAIVVALTLQVEDAGQLPPKERVLAEIEDNEVWERQLVERLAKLQELKNTWDRYNQAAESIKKIRELLYADLISLEKLNQEISELEAQKTTLVAKLAGAKRLKELAEFAAIAACDVILENINENGREWLDKFFPTDGTSIVLKNGTVTKTGNERAKLSTSVFHKGKEAKRLGSLSGGERSRVYLAFQLALSEMYRSPMLLIDEGFAGLHPELKADCIEILKEFASSRLVLVVEHGANQAQFQDVINFA